MFKIFHLRKDNRNNRDLIIVDYNKSKKIVANHNIFDIRCAIISIERKRKRYRKCKQLNYVILVKA